MSKGHGAGRGLELLENRLLFSLFGPAGLEPGALNDVREDAKGGGGRPVAGPEIRLDIVALHEFGHSLGLGHYDEAPSIMNAFYNAAYDVAAFPSDPAVGFLRDIYSSSAIHDNATAWKDSLDSQPGNGVVNLTYSFVLDRARMDQGGRSNTFATLDKRFGAGAWQSVFATELDRWASVSNGGLSFAPIDADGIENAIYDFNVGGSVQNDGRFGDIRIATHRFDGAGGTLAHAYFPPPNGATAAGDAHFDAGENWVLSESAATTSGSGSLVSSEGGLVTAAAGDEERSLFASVRIKADESVLG